MGFRNGQTASGVEVVTGAATPVNYCALQVVASGNLTFKDGNGAQTALTAVPAGTRIDCQITEVSVSTGTVLGYKA